MYETFDHTADLGLRVRAPDLPTLLAEAARGLFEMIVTDLATVRPERKVAFQLKADAPDYLLFDWLNELLYTFETEHLLLGQFDVRVDEAGLAAEAWGEPLDPARHQLEHEVKAITYHALVVEKRADGWFAEVIVDI
jgi:SHS2 domain-containing protein